MDIDLEKIKSQKSTKDLLKFSIINIDKPSGPTSFQVSQFVKNALGLNKTSHFGTLDPMVSGVLPVALGRACRLNEYFMHRNKTYVGIMRLHEKVSEKQLNSIIQKFIGKITQLPPLRSRVKRAERVREIKSFKVLEINNQDILFETEVEAGTYIRKLIHDMGKELGGAHMLELRRVQAGLFKEKTSITLYDLEKAIEEYKKGNDSLLRSILSPGESVSLLIPVLHIEKQVVKKCLSGSPIFPSFLSNKEEIKNIKADSKVCVFCKGIFIGCYKFIAQKEILAVPEFVFN